MAIDRRMFLQRAAMVLGASLSSGCVQAVLARDPDQPLRNGAPLLPERPRRLLEAAADRIVPKTDTPGALDAGVPEFIEFMLAEGVERSDRDAFLDGIDGLDALANQRFGRGFVELDGESRDAVLTELEMAEFASGPPGGGLPFGAPVAKPFFAQLKEWTVVGYYTSEVGVAAERSYSHHPGRFDGCVPVTPGQKPWIGGL